MSVSVDHWRAGLRASPGQWCVSGQLECQSIIGALACAPPSSWQPAKARCCVSRSLARWPARRSFRCRMCSTRLRVSRSLARWPARRTRRSSARSRPPRVSRSLARWPARLQSFKELRARFRGVSRSLARWPARQPRSQVLIIPLVALAFASATPSAYSTGSRTVISDLPNPSGGKS